jgi:hypothetical protein
MVGPDTSKSPPVRSQTQISPSDADAGRVRDAVAHLGFDRVDLFEAVRRAADDAPEVAELGTHCRTTVVPVRR